MKMTNRWNQFIYRIWAPVYDTFMGRFFLPGRKRAMESLGLKPGERVLLVGVGTGADLELLPERSKSSRDRPQPGNAGTLPVEAAAARAGR